MAIENTTQGQDPTPKASPKVGPPVTPDEFEGLQILMEMDDMAEKHWLGGTNSDGCKARWVSQSTMTENNRRGSDRMANDQAWGAQKYWKAFRSALKYMASTLPKDDLIKVAERVSMIWREIPFDESTLRCMCNKLDDSQRWHMARNLKADRKTEDIFIAKKADHEASLAAANEGRAWPILPGDYYDHQMKAEVVVYPDFSRQLSNYMKNMLERSDEVAKDNVNKGHQEYWNAPSASSWGGNKW